MCDDHTKPKTKPQHKRPSLPIEPSSRSFTRRVLVPVFTLIALFLMLVMPSCQPMPIVIAITNGAGQTMTQEGA